MRKAVFVNVLLVICVAANANVQYTVTQIPLPAGFTSEFNPTSSFTFTQCAIGISDTGQIGVNAKDSGGIAHGLFYDHGSIIDLSFGGTSPSNIAATSSTGAVVGQRQGAGFLLNQGQVTNLGSVTPTGVNNSGEVVGLMANSHLFTYASGVTTDLGALPSRNSTIGVDGTGRIVTAYFYSATGGIDGRIAYHLERYSNGSWNDLSVGYVPGPYEFDAINDSGELAGYFDEPTSNTAFLYDGFGFHNVNPPAGWIQPLGLSSTGQMVGWMFVTGTAKSHAFLYSNGSLQDLNSLIDPTSNWTLMQATAINSSGQIVGDGIGPDGQTDVFLLNPVPEPNSIGAITVAAALGLLRRRSLVAR